MSIGTILLILLVLLLIGALPSWPYSSGWGYYPSGGLGLLLIVLLMLGIALRYPKIMAITGTQLQERYRSVFVHEAVSGLLVVAHRAIRIHVFRRQLQVMPFANAPICLQEPGHLTAFQTIVVHQVPLGQPGDRTGPQACEQAGHAPVAGARCFGGTRQPQTPQ